jgi:hypothetical protein
MRGYFVFYKTTQTLRKEKLNKNSAFFDNIKAGLEERAKLWLERFHKIAMARR